MTPAAASTVFVIDDDALVRAAIQGMLKSVGLRSEAFGTPQEFLRSERREGPSCLILDVRLPGVSGLDFQRELADAGIRIPIIFITGHGDIPMSVKAMKSGAVDFLEKPFDDDVLLASVRTALNRSEASAALETERAEIRARIATLTHRERDVLNGLIAGHPNKIIAYDLQISPRTVEIYRANVMTKMKAGSLSELVRMALVAGAMTSTPDR